jgi:alpha-L-fucosidase 2
LEGCASFLVDWLIEGNDGYLETNPSTSPEHMFIAPDGNSASVSYSSTMDMAIINEVFSAIVSASEVKLLFSTAVIITIVFSKLSPNYVC